MTGRVAYDVIVIGAGVNGLTTAAYLARAGLDVLVLERRDSPGGATSTEEIAPGYRCDTALHDVGWVSPEIAGELELQRHGLHLERPDPALCAPLPDGGAIVLARDPASTAESLHEHSPSDARRWAGFTEHMQGLAGVLGTLYDAPPVSPADPSFGDALGALRFGRRLRGLGSDGMTDFLRTLPMPAAELLDEWFEHDVLKGALGADAVGGLCLGPRSAGTAFVLLHRQVGAERGVFRARGLVRGGAGRLGEALAASATRSGVTIRYGAAVSGVIVRDRRAVGVALADGEEIHARTVASSADPRRTFLHLVGPMALDPEFVRDVGNIRHRGAWAKVNLALGELPRFLGVDESALRGVISLTGGLDDLERAYDHAKYGRVSERPFLEARIPSLGDPSLAPEGRHVMSVRVQYAPYHLRAGWDDAQRDALGDLVVGMLAEYAPNLPGAMEHRQVLTPVDLEERFALTEGDAGHGELALDQALFMRPVPECARYVTPIDDLFLCGAGSHPGREIAGGAGRLAAREIVSALKGRRGGRRSSGGGAEDAGGPTRAERTNGVAAGG